MIDLVEIQSVFVAGLKSYTDTDYVIEEDFEGKKPPYPFIRFKHTTPYNLDRRRKPDKSQEVVASAEQGFDYDIEVTYTYLPGITTSFTAVSRPGSDANKIIQQAHAWFKLKELGQRAYDDESLDVSILRVYEVEDRSSILERQVEKRQGFDVVFEAADNITITEKTIELIKMTQNVNGQEELKEYDI